MGKTKKKMKRSKWKGFYTIINYKDIDKLNIKKVSRNSVIIPQFIGQIFKVYNGKKYNEIVVKKEMLKHKFGEFSKTRASFEYKKKRKNKKN